MVETGYNKFSNTLSPSSARGSSLSEHSGDKNQQADVMDDKKTNFEVAFKIGNEGRGNHKRSGNISQVAAGQTMPQAKRLTVHLVIKVSRFHRAC